MASDNTFPSVQFEVSVHVSTYLMCYYCDTYVCHTGLWCLYLPKQTSKQRQWRRSSNCTPHFIHAPMTWVAVGARSGMSEITGAYSLLGCLIMWTASCLTSTSSCFWIPYQHSKRQSLLQMNFSISRMKAFGCLMLPFSGMFGLLLLSYLASVTTLEHQNSWTTEKIQPKNFAACTWWEVK